ncbi:uncharacterized protein LOC130100837 [Rhinichthys klamathensis goyatoka]|uniref:uncharacterized protein LOC130100837 n=1 Tax=Rhinichthys klamathensis goyatoka TaxID=3034132 RepID=UPI0024B5855D|nr:uncharacterized protein LOC130100837 [Rhinichthys klamathensis goyatoka]
MLRFLRRHQLAPGQPLHRIPPPSPTFHLAGAGLRKQPLARQDAEVYPHLHRRGLQLPPRHPPIWPPAPIADASVRLPPLAVQAQTFHHLPATTANPSHFQWPAAQATPQADLSVRLPPPIVAAQASLPYSSLLNAKSQYSLFTATPMPVPPNAVALEPPPVTQNIRAQILAAHHPDSDFTEYLLSGLQHGSKPGVVCPLSQNIICDNLQSALAEPNVVDNLIKKEVESGFMIGPFDEPPFKVFRISPIGVATRKFSVSLYVSEIQDAGSRGRQATNSSTSLFGINIPITHPQKSLLNISLDTILQAVSPRTLQSYVTAWRCFKAFHLSYNTPFPDFSLLTITSFISYLNSVKSLQVGSIKSYLSGIQFFHKLIHGAPSPEINNSQTSLLIKGIQRSQPTRPDTRQPITLDILTKCIHTLRSGYRSLNTSRTLDAMFILAFFGFLRCSELAITSRFDPKIHPNISDLSVLDSETISFLIKQSKTDQTKKGHFIYIFNLSSPIQPFQTILAYLQLRNSHAKSHLEPLFIDDSNKPVTRFWFQKHLKSVLQLSGIPAENFSSHSFRIGAATSAAQKGLSQQQIQALGRWSSDAFQTYIRTNRFHIQKAHQILIG